MADMKAALNFTLGKRQSITEENGLNYTDDIQYPSALDWFYSSSTDQSLPLVWSSYR